MQRRAARARVLRGQQHPRDAHGPCDSSRHGVWQRRCCRRRKRSAKRESCGRASAADVSDDYGSQQRHVRARHFRVLFRQRQRRRRQSVCRNAPCFRQQPVRRRPRHDSNDGILSGASRSRHRVLDRHNRYIPSQQPGRKCDPPCSPIRVHGPTYRRNRVPDAAVLPQVPAAARAASAYLACPDRQHVCRRRGRVALVPHCAGSRRLGDCVRNCERKAVQRRPRVAAVHGQRCGPCERPVPEPNVHGVPVPRERQSSRRGAIHSDGFGRGAAAQRGRHVLQQRVPPSTH